MSHIIVCIFHPVINPRKDCIFLWADVGHLLGNQGQADARHVHPTCIKHLKFDNFVNFRT